MKISKVKLGFTLIELLVVISIIGFISTLVMASVSNARAKARDARRVEDIKQISTALGMYYNDKRAYPAPTFATGPLGRVLDAKCLNTAGWTTAACSGGYMVNVPEDPSFSEAPPYVYAYAAEPEKVTGQGSQGYWLYFALESGAGNYKRGHYFIDQTGAVTDSAPF